MKQEGNPKPDVLSLRSRYDRENWECALIYRSNPVRYEGIYQDWADMIIAKGKPVKRGEQRNLLDALE